MLILEVEEETGVPLQRDVNPHEWHAINRDLVGADAQWGEMVTWIGFVMTFFTGISLSLSLSHSLDTKRATGLSS